MNQTPREPLRRAKRALVPQGLMNSLDLKMGVTKKVLFDKNL